MTEQQSSPEAERLRPFIGAWSLEPDLPGVPSGDVGARCTFDWMAGEQFIVQRWQVPVPEAPDGLAVIGFHPHKGTYLQHYFDSRGVARVYEMTLDDGVWTLSREAEDFSPLDFKQRYTGTFSHDGKTIDGAWEICHDGKTWEKDFGLDYKKLD